MKSIDGNKLAALIQKLAGVHTASVVTDAAGEIEAVCVIADISQNPKWLSRAVKNVIYNAANVWLDYRKINVAHMSKEDYELRGIE